jgi:hypothetical protein
VLSSCIFSYFEYFLYINSPTYKQCFSSISGHYSDDRVWLHTEFLPVTRDVILLPCSTDSEKCQRNRPSLQDTFSLWYVSKNTKNNAALHPRNSLRSSLSQAAIYHGETRKVIVFSRIFATWLTGEQCAWYLCFGCHSAFPVRSFKLRNNLYGWYLYTSYQTLAWQCAVWVIQ